MNCIRRGWNSENKPFLEKVKASLLDNSLIPLEYLRKAHPWLIVLLQSNGNHDNGLYINYLVYYTIHKFHHELEHYFKNDLIGKTIGGVKLNKEIKYIIDYFGLDNKWVFDEDLYDERPDVLILTSMHQLTQLETILNQHQLTDIRIISLWDIV